VGRQVGRRLGDGLDCSNRNAAAAALLTEVPEVLLAVGRDLAEHGHSLVAMPLQPGHDQRGITATVSVAQPEVVVPMELLRAAPADERYVELVGQRTD